MRLDITGRQVDITPPLRQLIAKRLARITRVLNEAAISATVTLSKEKYRLHTEIIVHTRGDHILRGDGEGTAWPISMRQATDKLEQQVEKLKGKWIARKRGQTATSIEKPAGARRAAVRGASREAHGADGRETPRIIRATRYAVKPLSIEDVAQRIEDGPETFVVFRNADSDAVSILYRRKDGNLGLIEPQ